jgi:hypothetical protein
MLINAWMPVERIDLPGGCYTYRSELIPVELVRIIRTPAARNLKLNRWFYEAHAIPPAGALRDGLLMTADGAACQVNIVRSLNPGWKPPVFKYLERMIEVPRAQGGAT